ncbi:MAG: TIGR00725 family protein [Candidatus Saccharicenans sp.]
MENKDIRKKPRIAVIGGNRPDENSRRAAYKVGQLLAEKGAILICGGLGGVMEEAARGAYEAGGLTIGLLPGNVPAEANPYIHLAIATGIGFNRNSMVVLNADAVIAINGEYGTLSEIAFARIFGKKVIGLKTWEIKGVIPAWTPEEAVELAISDLKK